LWRGQIQAFCVKLRHNLSRGHPFELLELIIAFNYLIALMEISLMFGVLQKVYELIVFKLMQKKSSIISIGQLRNCNQSQKR